MKFQNPKSKIQGNSKLQIPKQRTPGGVRYVQSADAGLRVKEMPSRNGRPEPPSDLGERTTKFGEAIVRFSKRIPRDPTNNRLIDQLVGCGTSIGANYCEANERVSKKDFHNVIGRCVKEAKETRYFLRLTAASEPRLADEARDLYREAKELHLIFAAIFRK
jgi:four helix bundle protein